MTDPITETDSAFIDGQLDVARRIEVEDYLAGHPEIAARVMADMRARDALALAFGSGPASRPPERVMEAARRLERGLVWRRIGRRLQRAAAVAFWSGQAGWRTRRWACSDHRQRGLAQAARLRRGRPALARDGAHPRPHGLPA